MVLKCLCLCELLGVRNFKQKEWNREGERELDLCYVLRISIRRCSRWTEKRGERCKFQEFFYISLVYEGHEDEEPGIEIRYLIVVKP